MQYLVRLTDRAARDLDGIYQFIGAASFEAALAWFNDLVQSVETLEHFPQRGTVLPEARRFRQLFFGQGPNTYRIIYATDKRNRTVSILHIRHGARKLST